MNKSGLLKALEGLRIQAEGADEEVRYLTSMRALDLVLDYVNDKQIRDAVEDIPM